LKKDGFFRDGVFISLSLAFTKNARCAGAGGLKSRSPFFNPLAIFKAARRI
jgi:hypothetical protein